MKFIISFITSLQIGLTSLSELAYCSLVLLGKEVLFFFLTQHNPKDDKEKALTKLDHQVMHQYDPFPTPKQNSLHLAESAQCTECFSMVCISAWNELVLGQE